MYVLTDPFCRFTINILTLLAGSKRHSDLHKFLVISVTGLILSLALLFQVSIFVTHEYKMQLIVENVPTIGTLIICLSYLFIAHSNRNTYDEVLVLLVEDGGKAGKTEDEAKIQLKYENTARFLVTFVTLLAPACSLVIPLSGIAPQILDLIMPLNESRRHFLPFRGEHFIDEEKYFYLILMFQVLTIFAVLIVVCSAENTLIILVHHACGMYAVSGYVLQKSLEINVPDRQLINQQEVINAIGRCVRIHLKMLKFIALVSKCGDIVLIMLLITTVIDLSGSFVQVINIEQVDIKSVLFTIGQIGQFGIVSLMGQLLINASHNLAQKIYNARWYNSEVKVQKLFILLIMRAHKTCVLNACNMYVFSLQNLGMVLQTAFSYCMVLKQFQ